MRVTVLCEDPPDASVASGNGSTLVSAAVLTRLSADIEVDLLCFDDGRRRLDPQVEQRCSSVTRLPVRSQRRSVPAAVASRLPRATWRRTGPAAETAAEEVAACGDVLYVHGLHAFGLAVHLQRATRRPAVFNEIDDWSEHFGQRAERDSGPRRWYAAGQAGRTRRLEAAASEVADAYLVVAAADAERLAGRLGRRVDAVPNGVSVSVVPGGGAWDGAPTLGFLGSLAYGPNVEAVTTLVRDVLPRVRAVVPAASVVIAGRTPGPAVLELAGPAVRVVGEVPDAGDFYRSVAVMVYPGRLGTGAKNTVVEALTAGAAVVAGPVAARGVDVRGQIVVAPDGEAMAEAVSRLVLDGAARRELCTSASRWGQGRRSWDTAAAAYEAVLRAAVSAGPARPAG